MDISEFFRAVVDSDTMPVVICNTEHIIIYMNPAAEERYKKRGSLVGKSILDCHNSSSNEKIKAVVSWFEKDRRNNHLFTFHNEKENKDVYMIALRDTEGSLIGYYEKHEMRSPETKERYSYD